MMYSLSDIIQWDKVPFHHLFSAFKLNCLSAHDVQVDNFVVHCSEACVIPASHFKIAVFVW